MPRTEVFLFSKARIILALLNFFIMIASVRSFQTKPLHRKLSRYVQSYTVRSYSSTQVYAKSTKNKALTYADILELEDV